VLLIQSDLPLELFVGASRLFEKLFGAAGLTRFYTSVRRW
jgi:hypothetical protein